MNPTDSNNAENDTKNTKKENKTEKEEENILDDKHIWLICPRCKNFPSITPKINSDLKDGSICLSCRCNKYKEETFSINEYIELITKKQTKKMTCTNNKAHSSYLAVNYCFVCEQFLCSLCQKVHKTLNKDHTISDETIRIDKICDRHMTDNKIVSYCSECHMNLCQKCLDDHNVHHQIYDLRGLFPKDFCNKTHGDFKLIQVTFFKYNTCSKQAIDDKIKSLSDEEKTNELKESVKQLNDIYNRNCKINQDLIKLITLMFENYYSTIENMPCYSIINNLKNISKFNNNIKKFNYDENKNIQENIKDFIKYLQNTFIIKTINSPLEIKEVIALPDKLGHIKKILSINNSIYSGNWESLINIVDLNEKKVITTLSGHFESISALCKINNKFILSGGKDYSMNFYDPSLITSNDMSDEKNGELCYIGFIEGHDDLVSDIIQLKDGRIVSCGWDKKINVFGKLKDYEAKDNYPIIPETVEENKGDKANKEDKAKEEVVKKEKEAEKEKDKQKENNKEKEKVQKAEGAEEAENPNEETAIDFDKLNGKDKNKYKFYSSCEKLATFESHQDKVFSITELKDGSLLSCSKDKTLKIFNMETLKEIKSIPLEFQPYHLICLKDGRICISYKKDDNNYGIGIYKINDKFEITLEHEFMEHTNFISGLFCLEDGKIVTISLDKTAIFYNPFEMSIVCKINEEQELTGITQLEDRTVVISSLNGNLFILQ